MSVERTHSLGMTFEYDTETRVVSVYGGGMLAAQFYRVEFFDPNDHLQLAKFYAASTVASVDFKRAMEAFYNGSLPDDFRMVQTREKIIDRIIEDLSLLNDITFDDVLDFVKQGLTEKQQFELAKALFQTQDRG